MPATKDEKEPTTLCEICSNDVPLADTYSCPDCGRDPICNSCVCENCPES